MINYGNVKVNDKAKTCLRWQCNASLCSDLAAYNLKYTNGCNGNRNLILIVPDFITFHYLSLHYLILPYSTL